VLKPRMRITVSGLPKHGRKSRVTVRVATFTGTPLAKVAIRLTGKGVKARSGKTNATGKFVVTLKPKRKGAKLTFRATKAGYQPAYTTVKVR